MLGAAEAIAQARDADLFVRGEDQHLVLFGSLDAGRSVFVSGGSKQALVGSLDRSGWVALESSGFGLTRERVQTEIGPVAVDRFKHQTSTLVGYQWVAGPLYLAGYVGPELQEEQVTFDGRLHRLSEPRLGVRGQVELWANPTPATLLTGTVVAGSAKANLWARASAGVALWPQAFVGPEVTLYTTPTYTEVRIGAHLTGPSFGPVSVRVSAGWMSDDGHRTGSPYLGLSAWMRL